jgi:hypothetical protein
MSQEGRAELRQALDLVRQLQTSINNAPESHFTFKAPVIDRDPTRWVSEYARGINKFLEQVDLLAHRIEAVSDRCI